MIFADFFNISVLIIKYGIMNPRLVISVSPDTDFKTVVLREIAGPGPFKSGYTIRGVR